MTEFGLRPYRVFLVWARWTTDVDADGVTSGAEALLDAATIGVGRPVLYREVELLPTPRVSALTGVSKSLEATGLTEGGGISVEQVSAAYCEDFLQGLLPELRDPAYPDALKPGYSFWWEVQENRPAGFAQPCVPAGKFPSDQRAPRRRFQPSAAQFLKRDAFQWTVSLVRADGERSRNGVLSPT